MMLAIISEPDGPSAVQTLATQATCLLPDRFEGPQNSGSP